MHIYLFRNWRCSQQISDIDDDTQKLHGKATENAKVPMYMKATPPLLEIKILLTMYCGCCRLAFCSVLDEASGSFVCQMVFSISINVAVVTFPRILIQKTFYLTFDSNTQIKANSPYSEQLWFGVPRVFYCLFSGRPFREESFLDSYLKWINLNIDFE